jgi:hypothetical protein
MIDRILDQIVPTKPFPIGNTNHEFNGTAPVTLNTFQVTNANIPLYPAREFPLA